MRATANDPQLGFIYLAVNRVNGKAYVGQTKRSWQQRIMEHFYDIGRIDGPSTLLGAAILADGVSSFDFAVLERCAEGTLTEREKHWIAIFGCVGPNGYNIGAGGAGWLGGHHTAEAKGKISSRFLGKAKSEEHRKKLSGPKSPEAIASSRKSRMSPEYKQRASEAQKLAWQNRSREKQSELAKQQWAKRKGEL